MPWTAVRVLDWIGLEKEALGAGRGLHEYKPKRVTPPVQSSGGHSGMIHITWKRLFCRWKKKQQQQKRADLDSTSLLAACLYTCQAGAIRAFPSSSNISPAQSPVYHQKRLMTFFFVLSLHKSIFFSKDCGEIPVLHTLYTRKNKGYRQISQVYLRRSCISSNRLLQHHSEKSFLLGSIFQGQISQQA
jgi:hypothetical protein